MNKKGFTLIEMISIIAILSIISIILIPKIGNAFKTSKADQLESVRLSVSKATEVYLNSNCGTTNHKKLIDEGNIRIYLDEINNCGLIDDKIYNPMTDDYFDINNEYIDVYIDDVGMIDYKLSF